MWWEAVQGKGFRWAGWQDVHCCFESGSLYLALIELSWALPRRILH